jgi:hypothetical protein
MAWYVYLAYFVGGMFLANAVPHFVNGVSGRPFPSPFASPPGRGESRPIVNVTWGTFNAAVGYVLVWRVGDFRLASGREVLIVGLGGFVFALMLGHHFARAYAKP